MDDDDDDDGGGDDDGDEGTATTVNLDDDGTSSSSLDKDQSLVVIKTYNRHTLMTVYGALMKVQAASIPPF